jgi:hypothetical protein
LGIGEPATACYVIGVDPADDDWMNAIVDVLVNALQGTGVAISKGKDRVLIGYREEGRLGADGPVVGVFHRSVSVRPAENGWFAILQPDAGQIMIQITFATLDELVAAMRERYPAQASP